MAKTIAVTAVLAVLCIDVTAANTEIEVILSSPTSSEVLLVGALADGSPGFGRISELDNYVAYRVDSNCSTNRALPNVTIEGNFFYGRHE